MSHPSPPAPPPQDWPALVWRERRLALGVAAGIGVAGLAVALAQPKTYAAEAKLLVRLGPEYVFQPTVGGAGAGAAPDLAALVNGEVELLRSEALRRRVLLEAGVDALYPDIEARDEDRALALAQAAFAKDLAVSTAPQSPVIAVRYRHRDPDQAAETLNALLTAYAAFRRDVLIGPAEGALDREGAAVQARLAEAGGALATFLAAHRIADFDADMAAAAALKTQGEADLAEARARRREAETRAAALRARVAGEPADIELYVDSDAQGQLVALQIEREQLLSRYRPDAAPVRALEARIAQLEAFLANPRATATRRGPNPVRQNLTTTLYGLEAEGRALAAREAALTSQIGAAAARVAELQRLEPTYRGLIRQREALEESAKSLAQRAEEQRTERAIAGQAQDNISVVQGAEPPARGDSLRIPVALLAAVLALIGGVAAAVLAGLRRDRFASPAAAARALEIEVLAVTPPRAKPAHQADAA